MHGKPSTGAHAAFAAKTFVGCLPVSIAIYRFHVTRPSYIGVALISGVLIQALIPPHKKGLIPMLVVAGIFVLIFTIFGANYAAK